MGRKKLIGSQRSIIVACDVSTKRDLYRLVRDTCCVPGIGGYKIGLELVILNGVAVFSTIKVAFPEGAVNKPIIYDHQKGGTDIPDLGSKFAKALSGFVDGVILFPFGGAQTAEDWIRACQDEGLVVLVGGHMTQKKFLVSEGGYIADKAPEQIYKLGAEMGVRDFVVPGNKVEFVVKYKQLLDEVLGRGNFTLYAPGFIGQGGVISETGKVAGDNWHAIVGSAIYKAKDITAAAREITNQII